MCSCEISKTAPQNKRGYFLSRSLQFSKLETLIAQDQKLLFTLTSYALILAIYTNSYTFRSFILGIVASIMLFLIEGIFLGRAFFEKEASFFRVMLGVLLFLLLLIFFGWLAIIIYNLDVLSFVLVLFVASTISSLLNKRMRQRNVN